MKWLHWFFDALGDAFLSWADARERSAHQNMAPEGTTEYQLVQLSLAMAQLQRSIAKALPFQVRRQELKATGAPTEHKTEE